MNMVSPEFPKTFTPDPTNTRNLRDAFGKFATGVTVVTCASKQGPICITANSFSSISLDPAMVMWAIDKNSRRYPFFSMADRFAIHILEADQKDLCDACAKDAFSLGDVEHVQSEYGVPLISGCLSRFECTRVACHDAGDHVIIVGKVTRAEVRDGDALAFYAGKFGQFAQ
ncbi:MAG: flavin reductase family protein [Paracoccaceae bacterium]